MRNSQLTFPQHSLLQSCCGGHTWQCGVHDREHQGTGAEGPPAHVGKDGNTEAAQDETGIEDAAQCLERKWWMPNFEKGYWQLPPHPRIGLWPSIFLFFPLTFSPGFFHSTPRNSPSAARSHRWSTLPPHLLTWAKFLAT